MWQQFIRSVKFKGSNQTSKLRAKVPRSFEEDNSLRCVARFNGRLLRWKRDSSGVDDGVHSHASGPRYEVINDAEPNLKSWKSVMIVLLLSLVKKSQSTDLAI